LAWEEKAKSELKRVPFFLRPMVRKKVEELARKRGGEKVTLADFKQAEASYKAVSAGKSPAELQTMMPQPNEPGAQTVVVETCRAELVGCPNMLITPSEWMKAIENWAEENEIREALRRRIPGDRVLYHHKLRFCISGCPNACSRPQIADIGAVGFARPAVEENECSVCGSCAETCPDTAITVDESPPSFDYEKCLGCTQCRDICPTGCISLSAPGARIMMGGRLGRHPHLAGVVGEVEKPADLLPVLENIVWNFIKNAHIEERFSNYWERSGMENLKNLTAVGQTPVR